MFFGLAYFKGLICLKTLKFLIIVFFTFFLASCDNNIPDKEEIVNLIEIQKTLYEEHENNLINNYQANMPTHNEYTISLDINPETNIVTGVQKLNYTNKTDETLSHIVFNVHYNAFSSDSEVTPYFSEFRDKIYANGRENGYFNITSVIVNGEEAEFLYKETFLFITLLEELRENELIEITLQYEAYIPRINHRTGANDNSIWLGNFIPKVAIFEDGAFRLDNYYAAGEPFYSDISNYNLTVTTPLGYSIISTGNSSENEQNGIKTTFIDAKMVRDVTLFVSNSHNRAFITTKNNIDVVFYYHSDIENIESYLKTIKNSLDFFSELVGPYPYEHLTIVETGLFMKGATSYPQIVFIDSEFLQLQKNIETELVQKVLKQWFYNVIGNDPINAAWLSNGLSMMVKEFFFMDDEVFDIYFEREYSDFKRSLNSSNAYRLLDDLSLYQTWDDYYRTQHTKGKLMIYSIYRKVGHDAFIEFLRQYYQEFSFKNVLIEDFINLAETVSAEDFTAFFEMWLNDVGLPTLD